MQKKDLDRMDKNAREYFDSLPASFQQEILQSGVTMTTLDQLETYCKNALESGKAARS